MTFAIVLFYTPQVSSTSCRPLGGIIHSASHSLINHAHGWFIPECRFPRSVFNHAGGEGLLSAGVAALEAAVKVEGDAGQIPQVLQKGEKRKEYGHGRQHYGDYPRQYPVYSEKQRLVYKFRYRCGSAKSDELILNFEKYVRKQL